jgi:hypothetical protein
MPRAKEIVHHAILGMVPYVRQPWSRAITHEVQRTLNVTTKRLLPTITDQLFEKLQETT